MLSPFLYRDLSSRLPFPSDSDQDEYLQDAQMIANQFGFPKARQVYCSWLAMIYVLSGKDLRRSMYIEKTVSVLLLSVIIGFLALMLFDVRTALLLFLWVLNCKYMLLEPNDSHALAASMIVASVLCFFLPNRALRLPASLFILLLSIKVREEMIVPLVVISACLIIRAAYRWKRKDKPRAVADPRAKYYWIGAAIIWISLVALFAVRPNNSTSPYFSVLFRGEFAGTYVNRTGLREQLPGKQPWVKEAWDLTYGEKLPGIKTDFDVIRLYPREELANIIYNVKITPRVAGSMFLAFDHPLLMLAALLLYVFSFVIWPGLKGRFHRWRLSKEIATFLVVWAIGTCSIVGLIVLLYISARHYVQLIPVEIIAAIFVLRFAMTYLLRLLRPSSIAEQQTG